MRYSGKISENFSWEEMISSRTAEEHGIVNRPGADEAAAIERLVRELLQPLRDIYGKPIRITSGYRCKELNELVGGVATSRHLRGEAADCMVSGDIGGLYQVLMESGLPFGQVILYRGGNFLHLSVKN